MGEPARVIDPPYKVHKTGTFDQLWREIEQLPEGLNGEIIVPGILWTKRRPLAPHRRAVSGLMRALAPVDAVLHGTGWWIEREPDVRFGECVVVPDLVGFRTEKHTETPDGSPILVCPDFCCEVLSPATARVKRAKKLRLYARAGVEWIWLVDPMHQIVEVFQTLNGFPALMEVGVENDRMRLPPFDLEIDISRLWLPSKTGESPPESDPSERI